MTRIQSVDPATAEGRSKQLLDAVEQKLGVVPNIVRLMANSPAILEAYLNFSGVLDTGNLDKKLREQIAIAVANANECNYCLSAHCAIGKMAGLSSDELAAAKEAHSSDEKSAKALHFARKLVDERGWVSDEDLAELRSAGFEDGDVVEIIGVVAINMFTNYFNHVAQTEIDFPLVKATAT